MVCLFDFEFVSTDVSGICSRSENVTEATFHYGQKGKPVWKDIAVTYFGTAGFKTIDVPRKTFADEGW